MNDPSSTSAHNPSPLKVIVGMSGGVDSSVSALVLIEAGYEVEGLFMKNWDEDDGTEYCTAKADLADAQSVCDQLGIELHTANFAAEYWDNVFEHFLQEYQAGRTPNPDILCNREIKFKAFLDYAQHLGADYIATGHYARTANSDSPDRHRLLRGVDNNKDQSYFLHAVSGDRLAKTLFPLGNMEKPAVRAIAEKHGFTNSQKKDSTGICFIGERKFRDFLQTYLPAQPGPICTLDGETIGQHSGLMYYTMGQRQGLGIGGRAESTGGAWYVADKDLSTNTLLVVQDSHHSALYHRALTCHETAFIVERPTQWPLKCMAKTRYRQPDQACTITPTSDDAQRLHVVFDEPQRAVTPGQSIVFYNEEECLGGGVIEHRYSDHSILPSTHTSLTTHQSSTN